MVPINFWRNSDLFKKKERFSSSKIDKVRAFQRKSLKFFKENLSNTKHKSLKRFWGNYDGFSINLNNFGSIWFLITYLSWSVAQCGGGGQNTSRGAKSEGTMQPSS